MQDNFTHHEQYKMDIATKVRCVFCRHDRDEEFVKKIYLTHQLICRICVRNWKEEFWDKIAPDGISEEEKQTVLKQLRS